jgi:outer membrane murein-binding lipoprotein Lpp
MAEDNPDNTSDLTQDLSAVEMLRLVLSDVRDIKARVGALEAVVEDRLKDTRPIWQAINERTERIEEGQRDAAARLDRIERQLKVMTQDVMAVRTDQQRIEERMDDLERRPN